MFYSKTIKNLELANMTVSEGVSPSPKWGGGGETGSLPPPRKSATDYYD